MVPSMIFSSRVMGPICSSFSDAWRGASGVSLISGGHSCWAKQSRAISVPLHCIGHLDAMPDTVGASSTVAALQSSDIT